MNAVTNVILSHLAAFILCHGKKSKDRDESPGLGLLFEDLHSPQNEVIGQDGDRSKHHCKRLKTFSTTR